MADNHRHHYTLVTTANVPERSLTLVVAKCDCGHGIYEKEIAEQLNRLPFVEKWLSECIDREGPW